MVQFNVQEFRFKVVGEPLDGYSVNVEPKYDQVDFEIFRS